MVKSLKVAVYLFGVVGYESFSTTAGSLSLRSFGPADAQGIWSNGGRNRRFLLQIDCIRRWSK